MRDSKNKLTAREKLFCLYFVSYGSAEEAAYNAGFEKNPRRVGEELLCRKEISEEINRLSTCRAKALSEAERIGYQRLAFGKITDAVSLLYMDKPDYEQLEHMDLFLVSEIRRPKDGAMEIKFFDRLKALEKLNCDGKAESGAAPFYNAILRGAKALGSDENGD